MTVPTTQNLYSILFQKQLKEQCQKFATCLLDHVRSSYELEIILNYAPESDDIWEPGNRQTLERLTKAVKFNQKDVISFIFHKFNPCYILSDEHQW